MIIHIYVPQAQLGGGRGSGRPPTHRRPGGVRRPPHLIWQFPTQGEWSCMIVKFTDNFLMIRGLIKILSALKMRNFTRIFPKNSPPHFRKRGGCLRPPYGISQLRPWYVLDWFFYQLLLPSGRGGRQNAAWRLYVPCRSVICNVRHIVLHFHIIRKAKLH